MPDLNTVTCAECSATLLRSRGIALDGFDTFRQYYWNESPGPAPLCPYCGSDIE